MRIDLKAELRDFLDANETLLWVGKPQGGVKLRAGDAFMIPFSLLWGGFSIFWEVSVLTTDAPFIFKIWGVPFVLFGLYFMVGRFFYDAKKRDNTVYGITDKRIIIKSGVFKQSIQSLSIRNLSDVTFSEKTDRTGTVVLGPEDKGAAMMRGTGFSGKRMVIAPALEMIDDARMVFNLITDLQQRT